MAHLFIETTIHIQRFTASPARRAQIDHEIQQQQTITSAYVWMEFQRTLGQDYQYLIDLLRQQQPATIADVLLLLGEGKNLFSPRKLKRLLQLFAKFLEQTNALDFNPLEAAYLLDRQRDWLLHQQFFNGIDQMIDTIACDLVQPDYTIPLGGRMSCRRETARCSLHKFLGANRALLQTFQADPTALGAFDANTQRAFAETMLDPAVAKGERNCWSLSDLIITLTCPPDAALWTTNLRHFEPLCQCLGRQLFLPEAPS